MAVSDMERGMGGRIEAAFEAAKAKGEAAFITFITAGYPTRAGTFLKNSDVEMIDGSSDWSKILCPGLKLKMKIKDFAIHIFD